ncbi:MAG: hypothetical protein IID41_18020 [Planctomycetes bacterium]|nr:hypothetical protein [Planctomycetota bacterium]
MSFILSHRRSLAMVGVLIVVVVAILGHFSSSMTGIMASTPGGSGGSGFSGGF